MFKSQLEPPPEYETTAIFVENIFDTVKKAKAAKAAAAKSVEPSYDFSFGNLSPTKKKKPRKNAKKIAKTKKSTTPKKKFTLRKPKALKETPEKRKKASPAKSPRKYTKRVPKLPPAAEIDDEEAAFILSSISQRSFDSFYSRLNSSETNKIHIPIDISSSSKVLSTKNDPVRNLAYYVMLDHNYWIGEPEVPPVIESVKPFPVPLKIEPEVQIHFKIQHSETNLSINNELQQNVNECCKTTTSTVPHVDDKVKEVNNNKFPIATEAPFEKKSIKSESTAVKKRWLRQAVTDMKSPKKRKKDNFEAMEIKPDVVSDNVIRQDIKEEVEPVLSVKDEDNSKTKIQEEVKIELKSFETTPNPVMNSLQVSVQSLVEDLVTKAQSVPVKIVSQALIDSQTLIKPAEKCFPVTENFPETSVQCFKIENKDLKEVSEDFVATKASVLEEISKQPREIEAQINASIPNVEEVVMTKKTENTNEKKANDGKTCEQSSLPIYNEDNNDHDLEKSWESVLEFHRLQLEQLQQKNKRFSLNSEESLKDFRRDKSTFNDDVKNNTNRLHRLHTRFSLFDNSDYIDHRKALRTSLSLETHHNSNKVGPALFQRSTSDISLSDACKNRWSDNNYSASAPFNSNSKMPFTSFYSESYQHNREETNYSTYRSQKSSWLNNQIPDSMDSSWEVQNLFATKYSKIKDTASNVFKAEENSSLLQKTCATPNVLLTKTKTSSCDPRLNPSLVQEARKEENSAPKKKVCCSYKVMKAFHFRFFCSSLWTNTGNEFR